MSYSSSEINTVESFLRYNFNDEYTSRIVNDDETSSVYIYIDNILILLKDNGRWFLYESNENLACEDDSLYKIMEYVVNYLNKKIKMYAPKRDSYVNEYAWD